MILLFCMPSAAHAGGDFFMLSLTFLKNAYVFAYVFSQNIRKTA